MKEGGDCVLIPHERQQVVTKFWSHMNDSNSGDFVLIPHEWRWWLSDPTWMTLVTYVLIPHKWQPWLCSDPTWRWWLCSDPTWMKVVTVFWSYMNDSGDCVLIPHESGDYVLIPHEWRWWLCSDPTAPSVSAATQYDSGNAGMLHGRRRTPPLPPIPPPHPLAVLTPSPATQLLLNPAFVMYVIL